MNKLFNFRLFKKYRAFYILLAVGALTFLFQAFDYFGPKFDDENPYIDQPTRESFSHFQPPNGNYGPDVLTDAQGFDNFDIFTDYAEQHISGNPSNPLQMFFGVNSSPVAGHYTVDGYTWSTSSMSLPGGTCCDPWSAYDAQSNLFYSILGNGNYVAKSTNYGQTFGTFILAVSCGDRNTLAADQTNGPYANYLYAAGWYPNANFARSTNGGASWTTTLSSVPNTTPGNMIAVGPYGTTNGGAVVFVTITGSNPVPSTFNFYLSTNGGASLTLVGSAVISPGYVGTLNSASRLVINNARTRPYPMIAFDNSNGTYRGRLYCVYASNVPAGNGNKPDIKLQYSTNQGATWSSEYIVNDNANPQLSDQWYPGIWCDKTDGKLYIKWYDTRNSPSTYGVDVYATYSTTGGTSFAANQRLTTATWTYPYPSCSPNQNCYRGDYDAIWGEKFSAFAVWYDGRNSSYANIGSYFPDFAMKLQPNVFTRNGINDSAISYVSVPAVKLYTQKVKYTATVTPAPGTGTITVNFLNRTNNTLQDTLTTYPDSLKVRVRTSGGVTQQTYTVTITGVGRIGGTNGTPIHKRTLSLTVLTGIKQVNNQVPEKFYLYQNYPNPFNPVTNIKFDLAKAGNVKLTVYNINGEAVSTLVEDNMNAGQYNYDFDGVKLASGVYFYKLETPEYTSVKKMMLIK